MKAQAAAPRLFLDHLDATPIGWHGVRYATRAYTRGPFCLTQRSSDKLTRQIFADRDGVLDLQDARNFAGAGDLEVIVWYDLTNQGRQMSYGAGSRPLLIRNGFVNTIGERPIVCGTGSARGLANTPISWVTPFIISAVLTTGSEPLNGGAYIAGADSAVSVYRDIQLYVSQKSMVLGLGEDMTGMQPNSDTLVADTTSIVTAIRNPKTAAIRGYLKRNGMIVSTFTSESQATDISPDRLSSFGDPDVPLNAMPLGWGLQELGFFNSSTPPSPAALMALEADQGAFFNVPLYGTLNWPASVGRKILASNGSPLAENSGATISYR